MVVPVGTECPVVYCAVYHLPESLAFCPLVAYLYCNVSSAFLHWLSVCFLLTPGTLLIACRVAITMRHGRPCLRYLQQQLTALWGLDNNCLTLRAIAEASLEVLHQPVLAQGMLAIPAALFDVLKVDVPELQALFGHLTLDVIILTVLYSLAGLGIAIVNDFKSIEGDR